VTAAGEPAPPALPAPAEPRRAPAWRIRRRRALASALRRVAGEAPAEPAAGPLRERLLAIAASQGVFLPPGGEADLAETIARLEPGGSLPVELVPVLAALLQPLFGLPAAAETLPSESRSPAR
jgi:hypothetical protein